MDSIEQLAPDGTYLGRFAMPSTPPPGAPTSLVFDSRGNVYVPDYDLIERFDKNGTSLGTFATLSAFDHAWDLAIDSRDNVYVLTFGGTIQVFSASGDPIRSFPVGDDTWALAVDDYDTLYTGGIPADGIRKFTTDGVNLGIFASVDGLITDLVFNEVPEPLSCTTILVGITILVSRRYDLAKSRIRRRR
jgi:sugar lactone lactonase YvrE